MEHPENRCSCDKAKAAHDEDCPRGNLAYKYQTLRCWIMNNVLSNEICTVEDWRLLQDFARGVLEETK